MNNPIKISNMQQLAEYQEMLCRQPQLRYLFFELTDRCNLNCMHCGSSCTNSNNTYLKFEVVEKTLHRVAEAYDPAEIMICLTGGEPFLHPDIYKIILLARTLGYPVGITSNGTLIGEYQADLLSRVGLNTITISVDGLRESHNAFRRSKDAFDKAMRGIASLKNAGIEPQVLTVIHKENLCQLEEIYSFLRKKDIYSWRIVNIEPIGRATVNNRLLLNGAELQRLFEFIREKRFDSDNPMEVTYGCSHFVTYEFENELRDYYFQCGAGTKVASIMANGNIGGCLDIERRPDLVQGNIYEDEFVDVWENRFGVFRKNRALNSKKCSGCTYRFICRGDAAHTWNYDKNEPNYCVAEKLTEVK